MRHKLEYLLVKALIAAVRVMPGPLVRGCGRALGLAFYTFDGAHRRIAKSNLAEAFPVEGTVADCPGPGSFVEWRAGSSGKRRARQGLAAGPRRPAA